LKIEYSPQSQEETYPMKTPKTAPNPNIKTTPPLVTKTVPADFTPSQEQIAALARRMMPEIKRFFADEQIQREFAEWQERQNTAK
jgi:hypothetical protein